MYLWAAGLGSVSVQSGPLAAGPHPVKVKQRCPFAQAGTHSSCAGLKTGHCGEHRIKHNWRKTPSKFKPRV